MSDHRYPADIGEEIRSLKARIAELERANTHARGGWHDGTRTRGQLGTFTDPDSASEEQGMYLLGADGSELLRVNDDSVHLLGVEYTGSATVPDADDTTKGIVERATQAEVDSLADTERFVVPGRMPIAAATQQGLIELATQSEVDTGTDTSRAVTPSTLANYSGLSFVPSSNLETLQQTSVGYSTSTTTGYVSVGTTHTWNRPSGWTSYDILVDCIVEGRITGSDGFRGLARVDLNGNGTETPVRQPNTNNFSGTHAWSASVVGRILTGQTSSTRSITLEWSTVDLVGSSETLYIDEVNFRVWASRVT